MLSPFVAAGAVLMSSAVVKAIGASTEHTILSQDAPEFPLITYRQLLLCSAWVEALASTYLLGAGNPVIKARTLGGLVGLFWIYHAAVSMAGIEGPCPCLGNMWHWTSFSVEAVRWLSRGLLAILTFCAVAAIVGVRRPDPNPDDNDSPTVAKGRLH